MPERVVRIVITGDSTGAVRAFTAATAAAERSQARLKTVGLGMQSVGRSMIGLGAPLALAGGYAIKTAISFQKSMEMIHTQAGATQGEVNRLSGRVLDLSKSMAQSPQELSQGLFHLESVGLRAGKAISALKTAALGAAVGGSSLEDTATALGSAWLVNIKGAGNLRHVMGLLNATVGAGNMRMDDLVQALGVGLLPAAKQAGLGIRDALGALAVFTDEGYQSSSAAAQLATSLHFLYNPGKKASDALASIHLSNTALADDLHKPKGLLVALRDLKDHLSTLSQTQQEQVLGNILPGGRGRILLVLLNQLDRYQMKLGQIQKTAGNFNEDVRRTQATAAYKLASAWSTVQASLIRLGATLLPIVAKILPKLAQWVEKAANWFAKLPQPIKNITLAFVAFLVIGGPILILLGKVVLAFSAVKTAILFLGGPIAKAVKWIFGMATASEAASARVIAANTAEGASFRRVGGAAFRLLGTIAGIGAAAVTAQLELAKLTGGQTGGSGVSGASRPTATIEKHTGGGLNSTINAIRNAPGKLLSSLNPFASGGIVHGPSGVDQVLARLTAGEGVLTQRGVASIGGAQGVAAINRGGGAAPVLQPTPVMVYLDGKVLVRAMTQQVLRRAARGPSSLVGGSLITGAPGAIDLGATP